MLVLGVESSCDETSVAVVKDGKEVLSCFTNTQIKIHEKFGGVVPEVASRHHVYQVSMVFEEALKAAGVTPEEIDLVAVTEGPGLIGSLLVGVNAAKTFSMMYHKPLIGVHHLAGHIYANAIEHEMKFPCIALLVSGGNTELIYMKKHFSFEILGQTLDDAVGEAYDKVARVVGLPYPGGPHVDRLAHEGKDTYHLPRVYLEDGSYNFSFSGLKSAVINLAHNANQRGEEINVNDLCASFQDSVTEVLVRKTLALAKEKGVENIIVAGGVSANKGLKERFMAEAKGFNVCIPSIKYCTDNAAMIAAAGYYQYQEYPGLADLRLNADASLELEDKYPLKEE
ncbi:O-sialoglycoprotein endopeptidase [Anaeroplasma bactoclasticum]|jgi:N6-L-threonylcarbamoyladenine synthase|uniref:tRNA N6-adenosine threonylcarbamoyltransferase n=1 Tax=Anaeroplasma bactoclasticum TaxID=2088 RepID=A0A397RVL6_9MOLU|nr:tRNA (adenosine(37)-N6)-threonylcarbamoyltransferase complex transferase subunit TsaD [Anaeroplasma bactoclasticum]RIA78233.1 O-sialoglycoprotein endopeptidase [Anaeroplasma bactoclasticum]